jgi:hypothetical protein
MEDVTAKTIEFYIPQSFRKVSKWFPPGQTGKVLVFSLAERKSASDGTNPHRQMRIALAESTVI